MKIIAKIVIIAGLFTTSLTYATTMHERTVTFYKQQIDTIEKIIANYNTLIPHASQQQKKTIFHAMSNLSKTIKMFKRKAKNSL